jgi:hypothetical protein
LRAGHKRARKDVDGWREGSGGGHAGVGGGRAPPPQQQQQPQPQPPQPQPCVCVSIRSGRGEGAAAAAAARSRRSRRSRAAAAAAAVFVCIHQFFKPTQVVMRSGNDIENFHNHDSFSVQFFLLCPPTVTYLTLGCYDKKSRSTLREVRSP